MIQPWFSHPHWLAFLSLFAVVAVCEAYVEQGRHRRLVTALYGVAVLLGLALLAIAALAEFSGQPRLVVLAFALAGAVLAASCAMSLVNAHRRYDVTEMRRMAAEDL